MKGREDIWERVVFWTGLAIVLVLPLVVDIATAGSFRTPKSLLAKVFWALLAASFLARPSWDVWMWPLAAVALAALMSALVSTPATAWASLPWILATLGVGALRQLPLSLRTKLARAVIWAGVLQAFLAITFLAPQGRPRAFRLLEPGEGRFQWLGTMGNPADVASFLVLPAVLSFAWFWAKRRQVLWLVLALVQGVVIVATQTLSALAALLVGIAVLAFTSLSGTRRLRVLGVSVLAAVVLVATVSPIRQRLVSSWHTVQRGGWLWLASARGAAWSAAARMFAANPILGVGFGQFEAHSFRYLTAAELAQRARVLDTETGFGEAHNEFLQYAAETGLVGLALLAGSLWFAVKAKNQAKALSSKGRGRLGDARGSSHVSWPKAPLLACAVVVSLFQFPLHLAAIAGQWAVVAALFLPPLSSPRWRKAGAGFGIVLVLAAGLASWEQWRALRAVQSAEVLVSLLRQKPRDARRQTLAFEAYQGLYPKLTFLPFDYRAQTTAGNLAQEAGDWPRAVAHFRRALAFAERPENRFNLGVALFALGQETEALTHLVRAVEFNPTVLKAVTDKTLASRLASALEANGYFQQFPWTKAWLTQ